MEKSIFEKENLNKLLLTFALPCVISFLINSVYNIVDQIFIGQGVGVLGNAATNVLFPLAILFSAVAGLIGIGATTLFSIQLGKKNNAMAANIVGQSITLSVIVSLILGVAAFIAMPQLIMFFGCTESVYPYALDYGRVICFGVPFMMVFSTLSNIVRADGSPNYSMYVLVAGAILNILLDPLFVFVLHMGVVGAGIATVIGQIVSFVLFVLYRFKTITLHKNCFRIDGTSWSILKLGFASFVTQSTVLVLFVFMNNMLTGLGAESKFGADIPLSVYGVLSKVNSVYASIVLGISIGAQPIVGYHFGAGNYVKVQVLLKKIVTVNLVIGMMFNVVLFFFPRELAGLFITSADRQYELFLEFAILLCHLFFLIIGVNALEMTGSTFLQSLGKVKVAIAFSFARQIVLFIPIALILAYGLEFGIYGLAYAGCIVDGVCFVLAVFMLRAEYRRLDGR